MLSTWISHNTRENVLRAHLAALDAPSRCRLRKHLVWSDTMSYRRVRPRQVTGPTGRCITRSHPALPLSLSAAAQCVAADMVRRQYTA
jgi:hypothetical protein